MVEYLTSLGVTANQVDEEVGEAGEENEDEEGSHGDYCTVCSPSLTRENIVNNPIFEKLIELLLHILLRVKITNMDLIMHVDQSVPH